MKPREWTHGLLDCWKSLLVGLRRKGFRPEGQPVSDCFREVFDVWREQKNQKIMVWGRTGLSMNDWRRHSPFMLDFATWPISYPCRCAMFLLMACPLWLRSLTAQEICEALGVEMMGKEHSGLDDAFMVLLLGGMSANHGRHEKGTGCNRS